MIFKLLGDKDYKIKIKKGKFKIKKVIPRQRVSVTNKDTGEVTEGLSMDIGTEQYRDITTFVKVFRPNLIEQIAFSDLRLFCYVMEKMNQYNVVELDPASAELYEYTGYSCKEQVYRGIKGLKEMSVIVGMVRNAPHCWKVSEDCIQKRENGKRDYDSRPFVKIYEPRKLIGMSAVALSVFSYICVKMDYEGCIKMNFEEFRDMTGYKKFRLTNGAEKYVRNPTQFYQGKRELKEMDVIRDITTMVDDGTRKRMRAGQWYRVNPNVFIKGNRMESYGVDE